MLLPLYSAKGCYCLNMKMFFFFSFLTFTEAATDFSLPVFLTFIQYLASLLLQVTKYQAGEVETR